MPSLELHLIDDLTNVDDDALDARPMPARGKLTLAALRDIRDAPDLRAALRGLARRMDALSPTESRDLGARRAVFSYIPAARRRDHVQAITEAVKATWPTEEEDLVTTIQELIDKNKAEGKAEGRAEGKAEGRAEGKAEGRAAAQRTLARVLVRRFGPLTPSIEGRLAAADYETLERWAEQILDVATPDDLE